MSDTIAAVASAAGGAARGIVRVSGPDVSACLESCFVPDQGQCLTGQSSRSIAGAFRLEGVYSPLPAEVLYWPGNRSYTRQPTAEIHTLGSPPLLDALLTQLCRAGARPARPGEFTLRAFLAGRIDLTQAEAVLGVIDATDRRRLDAALVQLAGGLGRRLQALRDRLLDALAELEAGLDFVEEDIEFISSAALDARLAETEEEVRGLLDRLTTRQDALHPPRVALVGEPNVGKSSLFNALRQCAARSHRDVAANPDEPPPAIVSPQAGATRDWLRATLDLGGMACELIDTAGVAPAAEASLNAAMQRAAHEARSQADLELFCLDATRPLSPWEQQQLNQPHEARLIVLAKSDLPGQVEMPGAFATSSVSGAGLPELLIGIRARLVELRPPDSDVAPATAARCWQSLRSAAESLANARRLISAGDGEELIASELRRALDGLGEVVGAVYTDDILDRVFSRFCIGK